MRLYHAADGHLRAHDPLERRPRPHRGDAARAVRLVLSLLRRGLAVRDEGDERDRPLRRAHVLQGHRAPPAVTRHHERDRRDRRRVQRLHRQGVHGLLRQVRGRAARRRARRARRHAPELEVRPRGDRAREGRDRRGDEHVLRHAAGLHRRGLRRAPLRRPAARLGHHRHEGHGALGDARDVPRLHGPLVQAGADGRRARRSASARTSTSGSRSCSATSRRPRRPIRRGCGSRRTAGRRCACTRSSPTRRT